jgi:hypothetical protein
VADAVQERTREQTPAANAAERPNHRYYAGCEGVWRASVSLRISDPARLARSGMRSADRLSVRVMAAWPRWLGAIVLDTTVAYDASGRVLHTTVVRWLGIPIQRSVETIQLDDDGRRFTVSGGMTGAGTIDETGTRAEYDLAWLGAQIHQSTTRSADLVTVTQIGSGFEAVQRLVRQPGA